ncbi:hypothetical protein [Clostridium tagluense]|uniref:hypothetical protein n=1 Tax=Clostridium tagluense TaxID=360422 RepID=UPI001CF22983|nr:hypothetical protein [Clostridium tagluense]MCB2300672.1 hypothetical protein [Clostridium tagluense]
MSKNVEYYMYEGIINETKESGLKSNNAQEIQNYINKLNELHEKFYNSKTADNDEIEELYRETRAKLLRHRVEVME